MKIILVGSLPTAASSRIATNVKSLIRVIAKRGDGFAIRACRRMQSGIMPIDEIVSTCLHEAEVSRELEADRNRLVVFREPGVESDFEVKIPHLIHQLSTLYRVDFYREILNNVDLVVGVGGELGLLRLAMVCEQSGKPIAFLPGSGGTADLLWEEYFKKSSQLRRVSPEDINFLKGTPRADAENPTYADDVYQRLKLVHEAVGKALRRVHLWSPSTVTVPDLISELGRLSVGLWVTLLSLLASIVSFSYWLGTLQLLKKLSNAH